MSIGEVIKCAHCKGRGYCNSKESFTGSWGCAKCCQSAGVEKAFNVICSACNGKGSVWVGPQIVQVPSNNQNL